MPRVDRLRRTLSSLPLPTRAGQGRPHATAAPVDRRVRDEELRSAFPDLPRHPSADDLLARARRLVREAAQAEFAREGVGLVDLPEGWGRAELQEAGLPSDPRFHALVESTLAVLTFPQEALRPEDARELLHGPGARDGHGLSLESASDLGGYLLLAARERRVTQEGEAGTAVGADDPTGDAQQLRDAARAALVRCVTAPLEMRRALAVHEAAENDPTAAPGEAATGTVGTSGATGPTGSSGTTGEGATGAGPRPSVGRQVPLTERVRAVSDQAAALNDFVRSEAGQAAVSVLGMGAAKAWQLYEKQRAAQERREGGGPGAAGSAGRPWASGSAKGDGDRGV
ncbi:hypothetical protein JSY14_06790 [Brachybacterium sp. EF45031]|uniref:hypothetical protein n=1 Tax=Brachybacterium sillae TaxID=2810536 RepID=UPI00217E692A|nr:hypothetical protein [Brachybacterium sillae]MCS6711740.1 hypothetical protein [Brachybacterium sillae]